MDISAFNALKTYSTAQKALTPARAQAEMPGDKKNDFSLAAPAKQMLSAVTQSETTAAAFMTGGADPHSVVEAMASAELAVETAVTIRNRVVEAYQELLRMPV